MQLDRFDHLVLTVQDLEKTLDFYTRVLGMEAREEKGRWSLHFGRQKINLHTEKGQFQPADAVPCYGSQDLCLISAGDIGQIREELAATGWPIELGVVPRNGALGPMDSVYLRDPDGNLIEIAVYQEALS